jgi:hypothetical protein
MVGPRSCAAVPIKIIARRAYVFAGLFFDILRGLAGSSARSGLSVVPGPNESVAPLGAASSAAPGRSLAFGGARVSHTASDGFSR